MALFKQKAVKESLKARVAIDGPTGSGKTWTALQVARVIAGPDNPVGVIDTENRSAALYAPSPGEIVERLNPWDPPYEFFHFPVAPPYDPRVLIAQIEAAADDLGPDGVLVIDSLTHYWSGEGGTLSIKDDATARSRSRNSFTDGWGEASPIQAALTTALVHAPYHVVVTMRSKMEYVMIEDERGRTKPERIGLKPEQRGGIEYEFTIVADMDLEHRLTISKSRCDAVADLVLPSGRSHEFATTFAEWLGSGVAPITTEQITEIMNEFDRLPEGEERLALKRDFVAAFGRPENLYATSVDDAISWVRERTGTLDLDSSIPDNPEFDLDPDEYTDEIPPIDDTDTGADDDE